MSYDGKGLFVDVFFQRRLGVCFFFYSGNKRVGDVEFGVGENAFGCDEYGDEEEFYLGYFDFFY